MLFLDHNKEKIVYNWTCNLTFYNASHQTNRANSAMLSSSEFSNHLLYCYFCSGCDAMQLQDYLTILHIFPVQCHMFGASQRKTSCQCYFLFNNVIHSKKKTMFLISNNHLSNCRITSKMKVLVKVMKC